MRVAVAASGTDLGAQTDPRFGRCPNFLIVETSDLSFEVRANIAAAQGSGAGIAAAQLVADAGAEAVIASNVGPNAFTALSAGGLKVYGFAGGTVAEAIEALGAGRLEETALANVPSHHGMARAAEAPRTAAADTQLAELRRQLDSLAPGDADRQQ